MFCGKYTTPRHPKQTGVFPLVKMHLTNLHLSATSLKGQHFDSVWSWFFQQFPEFVCVKTAWKYLFLQGLNLEFPFMVLRYSSGWELSSSQSLPHRGSVHLSMATSSPNLTLNTTQTVEGHAGDNQNTNVLLYQKSSNLSTAKLRDSMLLSGWNLKLSERWVSSGSCQMNRTDI